MPEQTNRWVEPQVPPHWDPLEYHRPKPTPPTLRPIPGVELHPQDAVRPHQPAFLNMSPEEFLERAFSRPFPYAALPLDGKTPDYAAEFTRDLAYTLRIIRRARPDLWRQYSSVLHRGQGNREHHHVVTDASTGEVWAAGDAERFGEEPHERRTRPDDTIAAAFTEEYGWVWPSYFGSVDSTALVAMNDLEIARADASYLDEGVEVHHNNGVVETLSVATLLARNLECLARDVRPSEANPYGLLETEMMSNLTWGSWDDSSDMPRRKNGELPGGKLAHFEVNAYVVSALRRVADFVLGANSFGEHRYAALEVGPKLEAAGFGRAEAREARRAADRIEQLLTSSMFVATEEGVGRYFVNAIDRHGDQVRQLDAITTKPLLVLDVDNVLTDPWSEHLLVSMACDPKYGLAGQFGVHNLSTLDSFHGPKTYHHAHWPWVEAVKDEGLTRRGYPGLGNEGHAGNKENFIEPTVGGFPEFTDVSGELPAPITDDVFVSVTFPNGRHRPAVAAEKHAEEAQLWSWAAYVAAEHAETSRARHAFLAERAMSLGALTEKEQAELHALPSANATDVMLYPDGSFAYSKAGLERRCLQAQNRAFGQLHNPDALRSAYDLAGQRRPGQFDVNHEGAPEPNTSLVIGTAALT